MSSRESHEFIRGSVKLLAVLACSAWFVQPVQAQGFSVSLALNVINTSMGSVVTDTVTVTKLDAVDHTVKLAATATSYWLVTFTPSQVTVTAADPVATATMTVLVPGQTDFCPGQTSAGSYFNTFTVTGTETTSLLTASASLVVNIAAIASPVTANLDASEDSYTLGERVVLTMSSNYVSRFSLTIRKPDGDAWTSAFGYLPTTFTKTTTAPLGTYTAELTAYYCGTASDSTTFQVTPDTYDVAVSVAGLPGGITTPLRVDGSTVAEMTGGGTRTMSFGISTSHTLQVDEYVAGASGYRYYAASNSWIASNAGSNTFTYETQVYLSVSTNPQGVTSVTPSKWYTEESSAVIADAAPEVPDGQGIKYVFARWTVDGIARTGNGFTFTMDTPHTLVANYDTYYMLTVESDYGSPEGQGYYKAGTTAVFSVPSPVSVNFGAQQIFVDWQGDYRGGEPHGSLTMDSPKQVTAVWRLSYLQLYMIVGAATAAVIVAGAVLLVRGKGRVQPSAATPAPAPAEPEPSVAVALHCTDCGGELEKSNNYCPNCGVPVTPPLKGVK